MQINEKAVRRLIRAQQIAELPILRPKLGLQHGQLGRVRGGGWGRHRGVLALGPGGATADQQSSREEPVHEADVTAGGIVSFDRVINAG